jgi:hypothetical protein
VFDPRRGVAARWDARLAALLERLTAIIDGAVFLQRPAAGDDAETLEASYICVRIRRGG